MKTREELEYMAKYREINKERISQQRKEYRKNNSIKIKNYQKEYNENNKDKINITRREYINFKIKTDNNFKVKTLIRLSIIKALKRNGFSKTSKTLDIIGCSYNDLRTHLESKFLIWMNWDNHGLYNGKLNFGWDIDHIEPLANAKNEEDIIRLNHYTNLQPLCSKINRDIKRNN